MRTNRPLSVIALSEAVGRGDVLALAAYLDLLREEGNEAEANTLLRTVAHLMLQPDEPSFVLLTVVDCNSPHLRPHQILHMDTNSAMRALEQYCIRSWGEEDHDEELGTDPITSYFKYWESQLHYRIDEVKLTVPPPGT